MAHLRILVGRWLHFWINTFQTVGLAEVVQSLGQRDHQIFRLWTTFSGVAWYPWCMQTSQTVRLSCWVEYWTPVFTSEMIMTLWTRLLRQLHEGLNRAVKIRAASSSLVNNESKWECNLERSLNLLLLLLLLLLVIIIIIITQYRSRYSDWLRAGRPRGRSSSPGGVKNFLFYTSSRPVLGPTQPPIQRVPGALSQGVQRPGREANHSSATSALSALAKHGGNCD
jgi:hypothetical protein